MLQFLIEAMILSLLGCVTGILGSAITIRLINLLGNMSCSLSIPVVIAAVIFSSLIGIVFGIYPANKAAKRKPIEALRYVA